MNFQTILEELDRLYESEKIEEAATGFRLDGATISTIEDLADEVYKDKADISYVKKYLKELNKDITVEDLGIAAEQSDYPKQVKGLIAHMKAKNYNTLGDFAKALEKVKESLCEDTSEEEVEDVIEDAIEDAAENEAADEVVAEEPEEATLVLECSKCGALAIKAATEVNVDEATDLVNVEEECKFCEEAAGYTIVGTLTPYGVEEEAEVVDEAPIEDAPIEAADEEIIVDDEPIED